LDAEVMLVGQNPGREEDKTGRPFVGRAGRYLDKILNKNEIQRDKIYITSVVKCRTPGNRKPTQKEIATSMPYLLNQIEKIDPKIIVLMGKVAWKTPRQDDREYIKTYHPAAAMRFPKIRRKFEDDFKKLAKKL
jgi:DNA polymerase